MSKCSRTGPRLSAGKNVNAPTIRITPMRSAVNNGVVTGNVPRDGGTYFLPARLPAIANIGMIMRNRPANMVSAVVVLYQGVFTVKPPKLEPLLAALETKVYNISLRPWGPEFAMLNVPNPFTLDTAVKTRII